MRRLRWFAPMLAGCGRIAFGPVASDGRDEPVDGTVVSPACTAWSTWSAPSSLPEFATGTIEYDPTFATDDATLWMVRYMGPQQDIVRLTKGAGGTYANEIPESVNDDVEDDADPAIAGDALDLVWVRRLSPTVVHESQRGSALAPFPGGAPALGLETSAINSLDMSGDGLHLCYEIGGALFDADRASRSDPWVLRGSLGISGAWPTLRSDGLELYYQRPGALYARSRASITDAFGPEVMQVPLGAGEGDAEISADGATLLFTGPTELFRLTRTCL